MGIEIVWLNQHVIRFPQVDDLIYFLQKIENKKVSIYSSEISSSATNTDEAA